MVTTLLFCVWVVLSFSLPRLFDAHNSFDHSWMSAMSLDSSNKAFSYGPLSWLFLPDLAELNLLKIVIRFVLSFLLFIPFFISFHQSTNLKKVSLFFGMLFLLAAPYFKYDLLFYISFWYLILEKEKSSLYRQMIVLVWVLVAPLYKFSFLPLALLLIAAFSVGKKRNIKWIIINGLVLISGQAFIDSYLVEKISYALGYSEYMAAYQPGSEFMAFSIILLCFFIGLYFVFNFEKTLSIILLISLFIQYKHGVVLGTPGYAFYLFFLPCYFFLQRFTGKWPLLMTLFSLWMIPFYMSYMGGIAGLFDKFANSMMLKSNPPVTISLDKNCDDRSQRTILSDYFVEAIGSSCDIKTFPSVQLYGFSPSSSIAKLNHDYLNLNQPEKIYFSPITFGKRNFISELSYLLEDLIQDYRIEQGDGLSVLSRQKTNLALSCDSASMPTKLVFLKLKCVDQEFEIYQSLVGLIYKYPEIYLDQDFDQNRIYYSSLKSGVHVYIGDKDDIYEWWNNAKRIPVANFSQIMIKVRHSGGILAEKIESTINKCLEVSFCQIEQRTKK